MIDSTNIQNPWKAFFEEGAEILASAAAVDIETIRRFIEVPPDSKLGDLATTIAFHLAKELRKNPAQIASEIVSKLAPLMEENNLIDRAESKGPYINLFYNRGKYAKYTLEVVERLSDEYGKSTNYAGKRALIESPAVNPSKPWHIGHTRNAVLGDTLGNVLIAAGWNVIKLDYINDLGLQIAQLTWKILQIGNKETEDKYDHYLGHIYVDVQESFDNDEKVNQEIREVSRKLEDLSSQEAQASHRMVTRCVKAQYQTAYRLGIDHTYQVWESAIAHSGLLDTARDMMLKADSITMESEGDNAGCIVAKLETLEEFKDMQNPNKILFRSDGTRTYTGADVATQLWKFGIIKDPFKYQLFEKQPNDIEIFRTSLQGEDHSLGKFDAVFNVIGAEQSHPQRLIYVILGLLGFKKQSENSHHIGYEFVGLEEADFSGRKGTWIGYSLDVVLDRAFDLAREEVAKRNPDENDEFKDGVAESVAAGAVRYFLLNASPDRKITFSWEKALDFNGDAAPYLQYSHARAARILERVEANSSETPNLELLSHDAEFALIKAIAKLPEEIVETVKSLQKSTWGTSFPCNKMTTFCYNLATLFSKFYDSCPVMKAEPDIKLARLELVKAFKVSMANCLRIIGVTVVDRM
ncbi:MAG: arginine--tRNA ligase [Candidatus Thorarchaeota archaeon]|nr:arginine--tRNA ligase [Candidatus Thorarchaeota archaeon]